MAKTELTQEKLDQVVEDAFNSFWSTVADHFPSSDSGDLGPDIVIPFVDMGKEAIKTWILWNVPEYMDED